MACNQRATCVFFIFGKNEKKGECYQELARSEKCPEGFAKGPYTDSWDFYKVKSSYLSLEKEGARCDTDDVWLGEFDSLGECADACASTSSCRFFIYASATAWFTTSLTLAHCYEQRTTSKGCPEGFVSNGHNGNYDFYALDYTAWKTSEDHYFGYRDVLGRALELWIGHATTHHFF